MEAAVGGIGGGGGGGRRGVLSRSRRHIYPSPSWIELEAVVLHSAQTRDRREAQGVEVDKRIGWWEGQRG